MSDIEERLLAALAALNDSCLVEYVLQQDYYTGSEWEEVAQLELDRRGKGDLPKQRLAEHAEWMRKTR